MEIFLQGKDSYGLKEWNGNVEVQGIKLFQIKRLTGSRNVIAIFRKFYKILQGEYSPITIPKGLELAKLDIQDFTQILVASIAQSGGRSFQKTYKCPNKKCKCLNPRVVDVIKAVQFSAPKIVGGIGKVSLVTDEVVREAKVANVTAATIAPGAPKVAPPTANEATVHNTTIENYLKAYEVSEIITPKEAKEKFAAIPVDFSDDEEFQEFKDLITDIYLLALHIDVQNKTLDEKVAWLSNLQGDEVALYTKLATMLLELSPTMKSEYVTKCIKCETEIKEIIEVTDYFFGMG